MSIKIMKIISGMVGIVSYIDYNSNYNSDVSLRVVLMPQASFLQCKHNCFEII